MVDRHSNGNQSNGDQVATLPRSEHRWPPAVREAAERLMRAERIGDAAVSARLAADLGVVLPRSTLSNWRRSLDLKPEDGSAPTIGAQAEAALRLTSSELKRLERQKHPDLDRLAKLAQIWKTIDGLIKGPKVRRGSLADLSDGTEGERRDAFESVAKED